MAQMTGHGPVEQFTKRRKSTSPTDVEGDAKKARSGVGNDDVFSEMSEPDYDPEKNSFYDKRGLVNTLHGNIYQLKLLMLFLYRAWKKGYEFNLGTEVEYAAKFDDVVFKYKKKDVNNKNTMNTEVKEAIRFLQAKHRQDETKKITAKDLLETKNGDFSLQKYFISYRNIKNNPNFSGHELDDFILCTNTDLDDDSFIPNGIKVDRNTNENRYKNDDILSVKSNKNIAFCKLLVPETNDLYEKLRETSDLYMLTKELALHIDQNNKLNLGSYSTFTRYHAALNAEVFSFTVEEEISDKGKILRKKYARYRDNFLNGEDFTDLSERATNFRNALKFFLKKRKLDATLKLETSLTVGEKFELDNNPIISEPTNLAENMAYTISKTQLTNIITFKRTGIIKNNIDKLAGHVLVQVPNPDDPKQAFIIFRKAFFDDNNILPGNLIHFRNEFKLQLEKYHIPFDQLKQYTFNIIDFKTCEETLEGGLLLPKLELPNDKIEDSEIKSFLVKLVLAVNQPNEKKLGDIIEQEMGEHKQFNFLNASLVAHSFQTLMLDWFKDKRPEKGKEGVWLDRTKGENFFNEIKGNIGNLLSTGLNLAYTEELRSYGIEFKKNNLFKDLENFLSKVNTSKKIFHIITPVETRTLSAIKIDGALQHLKEQVGFEQYSRNDSYIFMSLKSLLSEKTEEFVIKSFESKISHNLLIICCESNYINDEKLDLHDKVSKIFKTKNDKKVILITDQNNKLAETLKCGFIDNFKDTEDNVENVSFCDLTEHSKLHLLTKEVTFQGDKLNLNLLINESLANEMIDAAILVKLMKDEIIIIGSQVQDLGEVGDYYINRRIKKVVLDKKKIMGDSQNSNSDSDFFVIHDTGSGLKSERNIYVIDNFESAKCKFEKLRREIPKSNIHLLKSDAGKMTWCKSHGSISNLIPCKVKITDKVDTTNNIKLSLEDILEDGNKMVIISDIAGMGKTIALTKLSIILKEKNASLWVVKINLNDHTKLFDEERKKRKAANLKFSDQDIDQTVNFLLNDLLILQNQSHYAKDLEDKLFKNRLISDGKIALLFDGFDEISPNYKDIVIDLIQSLKKSKVNKLFITTRPNVGGDLETELGVLSHTLEPLSSQEMIDFLTKFWNKTLGLNNSDNKHKNRLNKYVKCIIEQISKSIIDEEQQFIAIPLQTKMIADIFQENQERIVPEWQSCKEFLESENDKPNLPKDFALLDLYEHFVKRKFYKHYLEEKRHRDFSKPYELEDADEAYIIFKDCHELLALHALFNDEEVKTLLTKICTPEEIKKKNRNQGIVDYIIDGKPHFIHRTYAEYFASFIIARQILEKPAETLNCIENFLTNASPIFINNIIEQLKGKHTKITEKLKKPLLHFVIMNSNDKDKHYNFIKSLLLFAHDSWAEKLDSDGKTPLHYAIEHKYPPRVVKNLLDYANDIHEKKILHHGTFKNPNYENSRLVKFINVKDKSKHTALNYAMKRENFYFAFELLLKGASIESLRNNEVCTLINEMLHSKGTTLSSDDSSHQDMDDSDGSSCHRYLSHEDFYNYGILHVSVNQENKYRPIQEKLFLRAPDTFKDLDVPYQSAILSYFFVHARVKVIKSLLASVRDHKKRKIFEENRNYTYLDRINLNDQLNDNERLEVTKYLFEINFWMTKYDIGYSYPESPEQTPEIRSIARILQAAARDGHLETFMYFYLISGKIDKNYTHHVCSMAATYNRINIIKYITSKQQKTFEGNTSLHAVCDRGAKLKIVKHLIDCGDINSKNDLHQTPLFMALFDCSKLRTIKYLVDKGADINHEDRHHSTPLSTALEKDLVDVINYFIEKGACISEKSPALIKEKYAYFKNPNEYNLNHVDENGFPRLHVAIKSGSHQSQDGFELVKFLLQRGADVNKVDKQARTPLDWAIQHERVAIGELLLQYGAIFDKSDSENQTPRELIPEGQGRVVPKAKKPWEEFGPLPEMRDENDRVCEKIDWLLGVLRKLFSSENLMQCLIKIQLYTETKNLQRNWGPYGLGYVDEESDNPILYILNSRNRKQKTLLHIAAAINDEEAIKHFLRYNDRYLDLKRKSETRHVKNYQSISIDATDSESNTPLHVAAQGGHNGVIWLLLEKGAIFNSKNNEGYTPEDLATNHKHSETVTLLQSIKNLFTAKMGNVISKNENMSECINVRNEDGKTPLHLAIAHGSLDDVQLLLQRERFINYIKINIDAIDLNKNTPLHAACELDKFDIVKLLLKCGVIYDAENAQNKKPLDLAFGQSRILLEEIDSLFEGIQSDNPQVIINAIRNSGTDFTGIINTRDNQSKTLLHYAAEEDELDIVKLLLEKGAAFDAKNNLNEIPADCTNDKSISTLLKRIEERFKAVNSDRQPQDTVSLEIITKVCNDQGMGLLHCAADTENFEMVNWLIKKGANVNATDKYGHTVLHKMVESGNLKAVKQLVEKQDANVHLINIEHLCEVSQEIITYLSKKQEMY